MGGRGGSSGLSARHIDFKDNFKNPETNRKVKNIISGLAKEYDNYLTSVQKGGGGDGGKGFVEVDGTMKLSSADDSTIYHEFAHSIASTTRDSLGMSNNKEFWKEIKKIRTQYREAVSRDYKNTISAYADAKTNGKHGLDEFFAEGFALGKMRSAKKEIKISSGFNNYSQSGNWADMIVKVADKYFKKRKKR